MFSFGTEETLVSLKGVVVDTSPSGMLIVDAADTIPDGETDGDPPATKETIMCKKFVWL